MTVSPEKAWLREENAKLHAFAEQAHTAEYNTEIAATKIIEHENDVMRTQAQQLFNEQSAQMQAT